MFNSLVLVVLFDKMLLQICFLCFTDLIDGDRIYCESLSCHFHIYPISWNNCQLWRQFSDKFSEWWEIWRVWKQNGGFRILGNFHDTSNRDVIFCLTPYLTSLPAWNSINKRTLSAKKLNWMIRKQIVHLFSFEGSALLSWKK